MQKDLWDDYIIGTRTFIIKLCTPELISKRKYYISEKHASLLIWFLQWNVNIIGTRDWYHKTSYARIIFQVQILYKLKTC